VLQFTHPQENSLDRPIGVGTSVAQRVLAADTRALTPSAAPWRPGRSLRFLNGPSAPAGGRWRGDTPKDSACAPVGVKLGDELNGFVASGRAEALSNAVEWLRIRAIEKFPDSAFAKRYR
jgi:hypothetical protein